MWDMQTCAWDYIYYGWYNNSLITDNLINSTNLLKYKWMQILPYKPML